MKTVKRILCYESGQGLVDYSLILSLVALAVVGAVIVFADSLYELYEIIRIYLMNAL